MADPVFTPAVDAAIATNATKVTVAGGTVASAAGYLRGIDWMGLAGLFLAMAGVGISYYFKCRQDERDRQRAADDHAESMERRKRDEEEYQLRRQLLEHQISSHMEGE